MFSLWVGVFGIEYDSDYGCEHRNGWSVSWGGSYLVQLETFLIVALYKAAKVGWSKIW